MHIVPINTLSETYLRDLGKNIFGLDIKKSLYTKAVTPSEAESCHNQQSLMVTGKESIRKGDKWQNYFSKRNKDFIINTQNTTQ